jgi:hypothetical protein
VPLKASTLFCSIVGLTPVLFAPAQRAAAADCVAITRIADVLEVVESTTGRRPPSISFE